MKIIKDEKELYKFLDIINKIFGKTTQRTILIGKGMELYFWTLEYCGVFISDVDDTELIEPYNFERCFYELKQLPNKSFVLDVSRTLDETDAKTEYFHTLDFITKRIDKSSWMLDIDKLYEHKAAKIAVETGKWLRDDDIAYLKAYPELEVRCADDALVFKYITASCAIFLVMTDSIAGPDVEDSTQMKIDAYVPAIEEIAEQEEIEDEDPMA